MSGIVTAPWPSWIPEWRKDTSPATNPARDALSQAGKTIVITGASSGIGKKTAEAYAIAGAAKIAILARREALLQEVKKDLETRFSNTEVVYHVADVTDRKTLDVAAKAIGKWDVLVLNAGYLPDMGPLAKANVQEWWKGFEINVLGVVNTIQAFHATKPAHGIYIGVSSGVVAIPPMPDSSSYGASKTAVTKMLEAFAGENPADRVHILHPGAIGTDMMLKAKVEMEFDTLEMGAHFILWLSSEEAAFTSGKFVFGNWDVEALVKRKEELVADAQLNTVGLVGWPYLK